VKSLLSKTIKTAKTESKYPDWDNALTYLLPNKVLCPFSDTCFKTCLKSSGRLPMAKKQMIDRTKLLFQEPENYLDRLKNELFKAKKAANKKGKKFAYRNNGTSDRFEELKILLDMPEQPFDQAYDYSKDFLRVLNYQGYKGYHLTFSFDGLNILESSYLLKNKIANVSMVFNVKRDMPLPKTHKINGKRYKVIDGDLDDLRFKDKIGVIVGLRAKGKAIKNNGEFVQNVRAYA
jgi:hypothetical protein